MLENKINNKKALFLILSIISLIGIFNLKTTSLFAKNETNNIKTTKPAQDTKSFFSLENLQNTFSPEKSPLYLILLAFLIGIITSFTPCVYPMIPITLGILQTQASTSVWRNFMLASSYVLGISTIYAILGYAAATTTLIFGQWLSNPWLVIIVSLFFIYLAFSMFGFYEIKLPKFLSRRENIKVRGSFLYSFFFGVISGTVASPCLTPALAILLGFVTKIGHPIIGFLTLFSFALGMGILLIVIGTFSTSLSTLPKAGGWMVEIKKFFGFVLLGMCIYLLQPFLGDSMTIKAYAVLALITGLYYIIKANSNKFKILLGLIFIILSTLLMLKAMGKKSSKFAVANLKPDKILVCLSTGKNQV